MIDPPKRFVGLHGHSGASVFDGMGPPGDHFKWCMENGLDAHSITEHGHLNSFANAFLFNKKWKKEGILFKYIPGVEAYLHPSLNEWSREREIKRSKVDVPDEQELTQIKLVTDENDEVQSVETSNALTVENEDETKSGKTFNPLNRRHHLVILPKTPEALKRIFHLVSRGYLEGFYRFPRIDYKMLKEVVGDHNDIIVSTACLGGILSYDVLNELRGWAFDKLDPSLLDDPALMKCIQKAMGNSYDRLVDSVGRDNVLLELQFNRLPAQDVVNRALLTFARSNSLTDKLVVTADSHYARPDLWYEREMYKKLGYLNYSEYGPDSMPKSREAIKAELYPKNASQVWDSYKERKELYQFYDEEVDRLVHDAVERTYDVAHSVINDITFDSSYKFPKKLIPQDKKPINVLIDMCKEGLVKRGLADKPEYVERLQHELAVIKKMNFAEYFITLARVMDLARSVCLIGVARGSGGGSLVAYCLHITDLNPIKYNCRFDRFLNPYREGAPDIDIDVGNRDAVLEKLREEFGVNNVLPISNYNTFKLKTLVKDISKFYGIPFEEANDATRSVEQDVRKAVTKHGDDKNLFVLTYEDAMKYSASFKAFIDKYPHVADTITTLFKEQRSLGRHAGGVVIMDDAPKMMPVITSRGEPQTPWVEGVSMKTLEPLGYIKYDLLGLETMRLIQRTIELILKRREGIDSPTFDNVLDWYNKNLHPDANDYDDQSVYKYVYHEGRFPGVFQCTSHGAQKLFMNAQPKSVVDIAVLTSIYRPGPLAADVDKLYLKARAGEKFDWGHPLFEKVLGQTDNLLIFQESVMDLAEHVAGFPKDQCDNVRRAIMKRDISKGEAAKKEAKRMEDDFVAGAVNNGVPEVTARKAYQQILWFAGYGFNRSHAVAYAIDSYMCAWLMTHYEEEWLCAYLESMSNNPEDRARAAGEIRELGYKIVPIDINIANTEWTILPGKKFMPSLLSCKNVGKSAIEEIIANRPYETIENVFWNEDGTWKPSKFNKKALDSLIKIGAFDSLNVVGNATGCVFKNYKHMYDVVIEHNNEIKKSLKRDPHEGLKRFYELARELAPSTSDWTKAERVANTVEVLGSFDVSTLVSYDVIANLKKNNVRSIDELDGHDIYWFVVESCVMKKTRGGKQYAVLTVIGPVGKQYRVNVWGAKGPYEPYTLCISEIEMNDFGPSTTSWKVQAIAV